MPYTNPTFDITVPADGDLLSDGDDSIRDFKRDVKERIESVVESFDDDPLNFKAQSIDGLALKDGTVKIDAIDPALNLRSIILKSVSISELVVAGTIGGGPQTVVGAEPGDWAGLSWADGRFVLAAAVTGVDEVTVSYGNFTVGDITLVSQPLLICVIKAGRPGDLHGDLNPTIPFTDFEPVDASVPANFSIVDVSPGADAILVLRAAIIVPVGYTITSASVEVRSDNTAVPSANFYRVNAGVSTLLTTFIASVGTGRQLITETLSQTAVADDIFVFEVSLDTTATVANTDAALEFASLTLTPP